MKKIKYAKIPAILIESMPWGFPPASLGGGAPAPPNFGATPLKWSQPLANFLAPPLLSPPKPPPKIRVQETP